MKQFSPRLSVLVSFDLYLIVIVILVAAILRVNQGTFTYTLDDSYIHMAVAESITQGHYGVNAQEMSAPSSSIGWPFLLAAFGAQPLVPLALNLLAAFGSLILFERIVRLSLPESSRGIRLLLLMFFIVVTALIESTLTGMEHNFQILVALLLVYGWITAIRTDDARWLMLAVVLNPLVRYENLALCAAVVAYWLMRGRFRRAITLGILSVVIPGLFSIFLAAHGFGFLPTSVLAKSSVPFVSRLTAGLADPTMIFIFLSLIVMALSVVRRNDIPLSLAGIVFAGLFLLLGAPKRYSWFATATTLALTVYLWRAALTQAFSRTLPTVVLLLLMIGLSIYPVRAMLAIVPGTHDIYDQQYQMHRFVADYWKQPVAINDLGWVSYQNDQYVLDLYGLASLAALHQRLTQPDAAWIVPLMREKGVKTAIVYPQWFPQIDRSMSAVAQLNFARPVVTAAYSAVRFYALDQETANQLREALVRFAPTLPPDEYLLVYAPH